MRIINGRPAELIEVSLGRRRYLMFGRRGSQCPDIRLDGDEQNCAFEGIDTHPSEEVGASRRNTEPPFAKARDGPPDCACWPTRDGRKPFKKGLYNRGCIARHRASMAQGWYLRPHGVNTNGRALVQRGVSEEQRFLRG